MYMHMYICMHAYTPIHTYKLLQFVEHLNLCHPTIKFTSEISHQSINFLNTTLTLKDGKISTTLYCKPTDAHNYLLFSSSHPKHCKEGIPYSQFLRVRRICSNIEDYDTNSAMLSDHFLRRGYPHTLILESSLKARSQNRAILLAPRLPISQPTNENTDIFAVTTFNPGNRAFSSIIKNNWDTLSRGQSTRNLHQRKILFGYRRPKNIRDFLVKAQLPKTLPSPDQIREKKKCTTKKCRYCPRLNLSGRIKCHFNGRSYSTMTQIDCKSNNLIYCLSCKRCQKQYVGQTKRRLIDRMQNHFLSVTSQDQNTAVGAHFSSNNDHSGLDDLHIHVLEYMNIPPTDELRPQREQVEQKWIHRLRTFFPLGLNTQD